MSKPTTAAGGLIPRSVRFHPDPPGGSGGGGQPAGQGQGQGGQGQGGDGGELSQGVINAINAAVATHIRRIPLASMVADAQRNAMPELVQQVGDQVGNQLRGLITELMPKPAGQGQQGGNQGGQAGQNHPAPPPAPPAMDPALTARIAALEEDNKKKDAAIREQAEARDRAELENALRAELRTAGVAEHYLDATLTLLTSRGVVKRDESGKLIWPIQKEQYGNKWTDNVDLATGAKEWVKGEGKIYVAPVQAGGSGRRQQPGSNAGGGAGHLVAGQMPVGADGKVSEAMADQQLGQVLMAGALGGFDDDGMG